MGTKGLKICKGCHKSFEPQFTDSEIFDLWFTEKEIEMDREHMEQSGHSHLEAPTQELCAVCAMDPDLFAIHAPLGGEVQYRKRQKVKRMKVQDLNEKEYRVKATDGTAMTFVGNRPPPQEIVDMMNDFTRAAIKQKDEKIIKKKRPWWAFWK